MPESIMGNENDSKGICPWKNRNQFKQVMAISHLNPIKMVFLVFGSLYMVLHFFQNHVC